MTTVLIQRRDSYPSVLFKGSDNHRQLQGAERREAKGADRLPMMENDIVLPIGEKLLVIFGNDPIAAKLVKNVVSRVEQLVLSGGSLGVPEHRSTKPF